MKTQLAADARMASALIVDHSFALREAIARSLVRDGWHGTTAGDGVQGLKALRSYRSNAVITDVHMLPRGGMRFWEEALALQLGLRDKFVFMSSEPLPEAPGNAPIPVKPLSLATLLLYPLFRRDTLREV